MEGEATGYSRDTVFSDILGCSHGIPAAGRPIVYLYEDSQRVRDLKDTPSDGELWSDSLFSGLNGSTRHW